MDLDLTIAVGDYDHVRDLFNGSVHTPGIRLREVLLEIEEVSYRMIRYQEWDVSEISMGKYVALRSQGFDKFTAIPVFPSRMFRHSAFMVRADSELHALPELRGKRVGIPSWAMTAQVYARAHLNHDFGVGHADIEWIQSGVFQPGRVENLSLDLPPSVSLTARTDKSLTQLLLDGEIDAMITAHPPEGFADGRPGPIRYLLDDPQAVEADYFRRTGIFPIMHVIVINQRVLDDYPWVAMNLLAAFEKAKKRSLERLLERTVSRFPVPWLQAEAGRVFGQFGGDPFAYGLEPNRLTLERFLGWAHEQHVASRPLAPEDLFVEQVRSQYKV